MTGRQIKLTDAAIGGGLVVMSLVAGLLVLGVAGRGPWSQADRPAAGGDQPARLALRPMPRIAGQARPGLDGVLRTSSPQATVPVLTTDDRPAARQASMFVERAVTLPPDDRRRWVRAFTVPSAVGPVDDFLGKWVRQLNGGRDLSGSGGGLQLSARTIGYRTFSDGGPPATRDVTVILWQQVARQAGRSGSPGIRGSAYVLNYVTLTRTGAGLEVVSMDGVVPGPRPAPGVDVIYPPVDR